MGILKKYGWLIGPLLLFFIFLKLVDVRAFMRVLGNISPAYLLLSYFATSLMHLGKIFRLRLLLRKSGTEIGFFRLARLYAHCKIAGQASNVFISDIAGAAVLMRDYGKNAGIPGAFVVNRAADITAVLAIFSIAFYLNFSLVRNHFSIDPAKAVPLAIACTSALAMAAFLYVKKKRRPMRFYKDVSGAFTAAGLLTCLASFCLVSSALCEAKALGIHVSGSFLVLCYMSGSIISRLPVSLSGIGTRDAAFIFLLGLAGVSGEKAVALSMTGFIFVPFLSLATLSLLTWRGRRA